MPASMPTASRPDSAQCEPVSRPMDSVQWATDRPSTPTPTAPTAHARRRACFMALRPRGWGLRAGRFGVPLTGAGRWTTLNPDMRLLLERGLVLRADRVLAAHGRLAFSMRGDLTRQGEASKRESAGAVLPLFGRCFGLVSRLF